MQGYNKGAGRGCFLDSFGPLLQIEVNIVPASPLSEAEVSSRLGSLTSWQLEGGELVRTFTFDDFLASLAFVNKVGELAEDAGHHPDIDIRYNKVRLALVTHDAGGLTAKDFELAGKIDGI